MAKTYSVVEINGKQYNAVTGQVVGTAKKFTNRVKTAPVGVVDGIVRSRKIPTSFRAVQPPRQEPRPKSNVFRAKDPAQALHKKTQKSRTLMRSSVTRKQPDGKKPQKVTLQTHRYRSAREIERAARAGKINKHDYIRRFGVGNKGAAKTAQTHTRQPAAAMQASSAVAATTIKPVSNFVGSMSSQQLERLLDQALLRADAHKQPKPIESTRLFSAGRLMGLPRWASLGACTAIVIILGGFFSWQNVPQISMRLAAARSDVAATVPAYTPSGFNFAGPVSYSKGSVSISFRAKNDAFRMFTIVQERSSWDSETLAATALPNESQIQTSQINGTTVYIYGAGNDATWVDGGIRYTIKDKANLSSDQIMKIAGSM